MIVLGISPLDKDATVSLVADGEILYAAGEERFSRRKQHAGFPELSLEKAFASTGVRPEDVDIVAYAFLTWNREMATIDESLAFESRLPNAAPATSLRKLLAEAKQRVPPRDRPIHGLREPNQIVAKPLLKRLAHWFAGGDIATARVASAFIMHQWRRESARTHRHWQRELHRGLDQYGLRPKLRHFEHHLSHAANAYYASGLDRALIVTLDGYGSGLCGAVCLGENGKIRRLHEFPFPHSLGQYYENVTAALGFKPDRHAGKIVGLAAYGDPDVLSDVLLSRTSIESGEFRILENFNYFFSRLVSNQFPMVDVAAAYQYVLELIAASTVKHWVDCTNTNAIVLSGGVTANVKMNQRIFEVDGVERIFVYPNMGDGGCGTGLGLFLTNNERLGEPLQSVYLGPEFNEKEFEMALEEANLSYSRPKDLAGEVARLVHDGSVVARFDGRMEYGPRALGNRSILYHAREPEVNQWLNKRLGRTEFMPFAPVTLAEDAKQCYEGIAGAEHSAEFMTITFDCTQWMREHCPAAVHVDGTARPQLIRREINPAYYDIVSAYAKLSGIPCLINTSFNMHEEPIVCTPRDAVRAFLEGKLDALALGPYLVKSDDCQKRSS